MENIKIINLINEILTSIGSDLVDENSTDIAYEMKKLAEHRDELYIEDQKILERIESVAKQLETEEITVSNIWKLAFVNYISGETNFSFMEDVDLEEIIPELISSDVNEIDEYFINGIANLDLPDNDSSAEPTELQISQAVDFSMGCLFLGCELSLGYVQDGERVLVSDENSLTKWITVFGNFVEYDYEISHVFMTLNYEIKEALLESYINYLYAFYGVDVEEYRDDFDGVNWDDVAQAVIENIF